MSTSVVVLIVVALLLAAGLGTCGYFLYQSKKSKHAMAKTLNKVVGQNNDLVKKESDLTDSVHSLKQQNKNLSKANDESKNKVCPSVTYPSPTCGKGRCPELSCPSCPACQKCASCPATPTIQELGTKDAVTRGRAVFLKDGDGYMKATSADQGNALCKFFGYPGIQDQVSFGGDYQKASTCGIGDAYWKDYLGYYSPVEVPNGCRKGWASANKHPPGEALPFACKPPIGEYSKQIGNTVFPKDSPKTYVKGNDATAEAVCFDHGLVLQTKDGFDKNYSSCSVGDAKFLDGKSSFNGYYSNVAKSGCGGSVGWHSANKHSTSEPIPVACTYDR